MTEAWSAPDWHRTLEGRAADRFHQGAGRRRGFFGSEFPTLADSQKE
jgi:hypothetical protein